MKSHNIISLLFVVLFSIEVSAQNTQERPNLNKLIPDDQTLVLTWLNKNCSVDEQNEFEKKINAKGSILEAAFWEAYELGPTEQDIKKIRATTASNYRDRIKWLQKFGDKQLGKEETKKQLAVTEDQYVKKVINNHTNSYKTAAVSGLGLIRTVQWGAELKKIANDSKNPARTAAQEALKLMVSQGESKTAH